MLKISGPIFSTAAVATLLLSGAGLCLRIDSARADNTCLAVPNASAPQGQHWYYHFDRQKGRKCWYLHTTVRLIHHAASRSVSHPAVPAETANADPAALVQTPAPIPEAGAPAPASSSASTPTEPHITILPVKTISEPDASNAAASTVMQEPMQQTAPEAAETVPQAVQTPPTQQSASMNAVAAAPPTTSVASVSPNAAASPAKQISSPSQTAKLTEMPKPPEMFLLIALALGIVTFLIGVVSKIAARRRTPIISDDPDTAWNGRFGRQPIDAQERYGESYDERDIPYVDPRGHRLADLHEHHHQQVDERPVRRRAAPQFQNVDLPPARPSKPSIEPALRVLRQARRRRTA